LCKLKGRFSAMKHTAYNLVFVGIAENHTCEDVKDKLARIYQVDPKKLDFLFQKNEVVVNRELGPDKARKYQAAFKAAGAICRLEPVEKKIAKKDQKKSGVNRKMICPKCGLEQDKADKCAICGIVIDEFRSHADLSNNLVHASKPTGYSEPKPVIDMEYTDYGQDKVLAYSCIAAGVVLILIGIKLIF
jgi:rubrerythrin